MALHLKSTGIDFTDFGDATETSELLDDYEEGTWTPANGNWNTWTLGTTSSQYSKVGDLVWASTQNNGQCEGDAGDYFVGLPYNVELAGPCFFCDGTPTKFIGGNLWGSTYNRVSLITAWTLDNFRFTAIYVEG